jgi:holo-[acyl-carrier protein] synthase
MEIVGIGSDVVECVRIGRMIERHGEAFLERVFTPREVRQCRQRSGPAEHFAGRWAAKQAVLRCLGARGVSWTDVEVRHDPSGGWVVHVGGAARDRAQALRLSNVLLTIAHCRAYATACAIAVRGGRSE